ncbi:MAG: type II toxin-antitoxin system RelE family toxin [Thermoplasmata archaeon]
MTDFEVEYSEDSLFQLRCLDIPIAERFIQKTEIIESAMRRLFVRSVERTEYRLRVDDYRVVAGIEEIRRVVVVISLGRRTNI